MKTLLLTCVLSLVATQALAVSSRNWGITSRIAGLGGATIYTEAPPVGPELDRRGIPWWWTARDGPLVVPLGTSFEVD